MFNNSKEVKITLTYKPHKDNAKKKKELEEKKTMAINRNTKKIKNKINKQKAVEFHRVLKKKGSNTSSSSWIYLRNARIV